MPGSRVCSFSLGPLANEENLANNAVTRLLGVSDDKRRILYVEGEPRWEYKFIRRAEDDDKIVQVASMLRTTENKIYRQGISDPTELENGFPVRPEDLFGYQGIILGSVEAGYFTPLQQELLREFVDRRGGGLLFLGGRFSLGDGGWGGSSLVDLLPTYLPNSRNTFHRDPATVELTAAGSDSPITRLMDDPAKNIERWKKLTYLMDYQDAGHAQAWRRGVNPDERRWAQTAVAGHAELRPRPHRGDGHLGHVALADEPAPGGSGARSFLAAIAALAGAGFAGTSGGYRCQPHPDG